MKRPAQSLAMKKYHAERKKKAKLAADSVKRAAKRRALRDEPGHVVTCDPAFHGGLVE